MAQTLFSRAAHVEIEGLNALKLLERRPDMTTYTVMGFDAPVLVQDFRPNRPKSKRASVTSRRTNGPAHVTLRNHHEDGLLVQLHPTRDVDPRHMLWIAVGLDEFLPRYDCIFDLFDFADDNTLAFLALYKRPRRRRLADEQIALSV